MQDEEKILTILRFFTISIIQQALWCGEWGGGHPNQLLSELSFGMCLLPGKVQITLRDLRMAVQNFLPIQSGAVRTGMGSRGELEAQGKGFTVGDRI